MIIVTDYFHHDMARPKIPDGGDGLQMGRLAENILNKQSRTANKGRGGDPPAWGLGVDLITWCKKSVCYEMSQRA
jgi:hypothetical protein